jgi:hypothetical protein
LNPEQHRVFQLVVDSEDSETKNTNETTVGPMVRFGWSMESGGQFCFGKFDNSGKAVFKLNIIYEKLQLIVFFSEQKC